MMTEMERVVAALERIADAVEHIDEALCGSEIIRWARNKRPIFTRTGPRRGPFAAQQIPHDGEGLCPDATVNPDTEQWECPHPEHWHPEEDRR